MAGIKTGRYGQILYDSAPASPEAPVAIASLNTWKGSFKKNYVDVTCFGDLNKVYVPGLQDVQGSFAGFWNSGELTLVHALSAATPGFLKLVPNYNEPTFYFAGLAYLDADIDCGLDADKVTGSFHAAGPWITP